MTMINLNGWSDTYPPVSEASREVANLNEIKNPHTPVYGVTEFVCLSVCLLRAGNNYHDSPNSQGGMKFATQISPLLNFKGLYFHSFSY